MSAEQAEVLAAAALPRVSIVVPTYKRNELLSRCLSALAAQDYPPQLYEIIVVDDAHSAETKRLVESTAPFLKPALRYLAVCGLNHGPAAARNLGWRNAAGEVVAFTDDDCVPAVEWIRQGVLALQGERADVITGRVVMPLPPRPTDYELNESRLEEGEFVTANCFCTKDALERVGGFDESFSAPWREDSDLHFRMLDAGMTLRRSEKTLVLHPLRPAPWGVSLRLQKKVLYDVLLYRKHPRRFRERLIRKPPWNYYAAVTAAFAASVCALVGFKTGALGSLSLFLAVSLQFCLKRLRGTSRHPKHIAEMVVTSLLIPFAALFWRVYGGVKYRVLYL